MKKILSTDNTTYKYLEHLKLKKYRDEANEFLVFGNDIILEARISGNLKYTFCIEGSESLYPDCELIFSKTLFNSLQGNDDHQIGALVSKSTNQELSDKILILDDVQDPSNVGMLLRSALCFGFKCVVRSKASADFYNEKSIRASKGSLMHLTLLTKDLDSYLEELYLKKYNVIISEVTNNSSKIAKISKVALVLGNEGVGVHNNLKKAHYNYTHIQTSNFDSLNVSVAGGIIMWELTKI